MSKILLILALTLPTVSQSAIPPRKIKKPYIERVLQVKGDKQLSLLKKLGPRVYDDLRKLSFNEKKVLGTRWRAFMAMVKLGQKESLPEIQKALKSKEWFLRDAAIKVMPAIDKDKALQAAMKGLNDKALVVRSTAVVTLKDLKQKQAAPKLWKQLYSKKNYAGNQSLWIRRQIVEALSVMATKSDVKSLIKVLDDADSTLFAPAIRGLERATGQKLGEASLHPSFKRHLWIKWFNKKKTS